VRIPPGIVGSSMLQLSLVLDTVFASLLGTGHVSWLYFADRLMEFPLGLVGIALATVTAAGDWRALCAGLGRGFSRVLDFSLRLDGAAGRAGRGGRCAFSRADQPASVLAYRHFSAFDVQMAAAALAAYAPALMMFSLVKVLVPAACPPPTRAPRCGPARGLGANVALNALLRPELLKLHLAGAAHPAGPFHRAGAT